MDLMMPMGVPSVMHTMGPRTTATSNAEGRMMVDAAGMKKKKKAILKKKVKKAKKKII